MIASLIPARLISSLVLDKSNLYKISMGSSFGSKIRCPSGLETTSSLFDSKPDGHRIFEPKNDPIDINLENLHCAWTKEEDRVLYDNRNLPLPSLASMLGRGMRGIQARLNKLRDNDSSAYSRLFTDSPREDQVDPESKRFKLSTASEVLHRIRWDQHLNPSDFSVMYFDRLEETIVETAFDATNTSVKGREDFFVFAIPEHRIMVIVFSCLNIPINRNSLIYIRHVFHIGR